MNILRKSTDVFSPRANMGDYARARQGFKWSDAQGELCGLPGGGLNIAYEAVDRHVAQGPGEQTAIRWLARDLSPQDISYAELEALINRFGNMLQRLGVNWGARVFSLLGRTPSLYIAALGALKSGRVYSPLFSAFGPEPVQARMTIGDARLLITTALYYDRKVASWRGELPDLKHVLLVDRRGADLPDGTRSYQDEMAASSQSAVSAQTESEDPALLHFTSGTTGKPKGAIHVHGAVVVHHLTGRTALDLHPGDIYWCTADPGSVTGTSYGINAPLTNGVTMVVDEAEIDVNRWYGILQEQKVAVWYAPPTGIRMLMRAGSGITQGYDLSHLRFMASMGEPLNPEAVS